MKHQSRKLSFCGIVCCVLSLVCGWFDSEESSFIRLTFVALKFYNEWQCCNDNHFDSSGGTERWSSAFVDCHCESSRCAVCFSQKIPHLSCLEEQRDCPFPWRFYPHDSGQHRFTAVQEDACRSYCTSQNEFQNGTSITSCFLSPRVAQESWKHQHATSTAFSTAQEFKIFRNTECNPTPEIVPRGMILSKNEGLSNWNKMVKPSAHDFKVFRESNNWVKCKDGRIHGYSWSPNSYSFGGQESPHHWSGPRWGSSICAHHQAKFIVKMHAKTKNARTVWEQVCKTHDVSISTSMNGDTIFGWLAGVKLDACN